MADKTLDLFFHPKSIAIFGASQTFIRTEPALFRLCDFDKGKICGKS
jgi:acyl-CoA synthetase (NDP forming)